MLEHEVGNRITYNQDWQQLWRISTVITSIWLQNCNGQKYMK